MKTKISGISFDETTKVEMKKTYNTIPTMKALVYGGPGKIELKEVPIPTIIKSTDALIKLLKTTICGTDLGILNGKVPTVKPGTTLGHEGVGVIGQVGHGVRNCKKGAHVIIGHNGVGLDFFCYPVEKDNRHSLFMEFFQVGKIN